MRHEENRSQIEGMYKLIDHSLKGIKDWIKEDPDFALKLVGDLEDILNIIKTTALTHEQIVDHLIEQKIGKVSR